MWGEGGVTVTSSGDVWEAGEEGLTGAMSSVHSPCPACSCFTVSRSPMTRTTSPTQKELC